MSASCYICGRPFGVNKGAPDSRTVDHIRPKCLGGKTLEANCAAACLRCNQLKAGNPPVHVVLVATAIARTLEECAIILAGSTLLSYDAENRRSVLSVVQAGTEVRDTLIVDTEVDPFRLTYGNPGSWKPSMKRAITLKLKAVRLWCESNPYSDIVPKFDTVATGYFDSVLAKPAESFTPTRFVPVCDALAWFARKLNGIISSTEPGLFKVNFTKKSYVLIGETDSGIHLLSRKLVSAPAHCPSEQVIEAVLESANEKYYGVRSSVTNTTCHLCGERVDGANAGTGFVVCSGCITQLQSYFEVQVRLTKLILNREEKQEDISCGLVQRGRLNKAPHLVV